MYKTLKKETFTLQVCFVLVFIIKQSYITIEMAHAFFYQEACAFFQSLCFSDTLRVRGGWLAASLSYWQKEAVWMGEIVSFMAYVVTGGQRCEASWHSQW